MSSSRHADEELIEMLMAEAEGSLPRLMDCLFTAMVRLGDNKKLAATNPELQQMLDDAIRDTEILRNAARDEWGQ